MIFSSLAEKLQDTFDKLKGKGKLSEKDVNYKVVKNFVSKIEERAVGKEVMDSLTPGQHVIKIVNEEMQELMGGSKEDIAISPEPPTIIMMVGLQGSGKTTSAGKLARKLSKDGKSPLLVAADVYRPAAIRQLQVLGERLDLPMFSMGEDSDPVDIAKGSINYASSHNCDTIILDTAGRLHIDQDMMEELEGIKTAVDPDEILLVVDAMTGQDAVNVADNFDQRLDIDGIVLTKMDGDARGGAALSIKAVTGKPIKFAGTGEKLADLEAFHPDRMSSRILGMGDVLSLIEKAEKNIDKKKAAELEEKLRKNEFTLEDFLDQMDQVRNMGPMDQLLGMMPGMSDSKQLKNMQVDEKQLDHIEAIINSMTPEERRDPAVINGSRRKRIAQGSGTNIQEVNRLLKQFKQTKKMMKQLNSGKLGKGGFKMPFFG